MINVPTLTATNNNNGTGTYSVSGSSVGTTNKIYAASIEIYPQTWVLIGTLAGTGDGNLTVTTAPGLRWFVVQSTLGSDITYSPPVACLMLTAVNAVYEQLLQAVGVVLNGAAASGQLGSISTANIQRLDYIADSRGINLKDLSVDLPAIVYGPGVTESLNIGTSLSNSDDYEYPILIALIDRKAAEYQADDATYLKLREVSRNLFQQKRVAGVADSKTTEVQFEIVLDHTRDEDDLLQFASGLRLVCKTRELRWV